VIFIFGVVLCLKRCYIAESFIEGVLQDSNHRREFNARKGIKTKRAHTIAPFHEIKQCEMIT
jgi:hypothetical protein